MHISFNLPRGQKMFLQLMLTPTKEWKALPPLQLPQEEGDTVGQFALVIFFSRNVFATIFNFSFSLILTTDLKYCVNTF